MCRLTGTNSHRLRGIWRCARYLTSSAFRSGELSAGELRVIMVESQPHGRGTLVAGRGGRADDGGVAAGHGEDALKIPGVVLASRVVGVRISWHAGGMRARRQFLMVLGIVAACGGDDESTATTMSSVSGTMTASMDPSTGPGGSDSTPTSGDSTTAPVEGAPVIISLQTNVSKITAGESVIFTAVLTDPDGVDDIVGGTLSDASGQIGYGPFVAAGQEGTYSISLSWEAMQQAGAIQFEGMDLARVFRAEFYDQDVHKVQQDVELMLTCAEGSACDGVCINIMTDKESCGSCGAVCVGGCEGGACAPKWGECILLGDGHDTCNAYCVSVGEVCAENGCAGATILGFGNSLECDNGEFMTPYEEPCDMLQPWDAGRTTIQCCCTDTK